VRASVTLNHVQCVLLHRVQLLSTTRSEFVSQFHLLLMLFLNLQFSCIILLLAVRRYPWWQWCSQGECRYPKYFGGMPFPKITTGNGDTVAFHQMSYFKAEMHQIRFLVEALLQTLLGELMALPTNPSWM